MARRDVFRIGSIAFEWKGVGSRLLAVGCVHYESRITKHDSRAHSSRLADFAAVIGGEEFDRAAHFIQAGTDPHTETVGERILGGSRYRRARGELGSAWCGHRSGPGVIE